MNGHVAATGCAQSAQPQRQTQQPHHNSRVAHADENNPQLFAGMYQFMHSEPVAEIVEASQLPLYRCFTAGNKVIVNA